MIELLLFTDYKDFLMKKLDELDEGGRGSRSRLSRSIGCHTAYTAQVLRGSAHFSLEQGEAVNDFLGHTEEQGDYFLLLLQWGRAGSAKLKARLWRQIAHAQKLRSNLKNRLEVESNLGEREQAIYYGSWINGAVHALASVPGYQKSESIARRLGISVKQSADALSFLQSSGILKRSARGDLAIGKRQTHLGVDSPLIVRHHINWRLRAMQAIESDPTSGLHYSSVISISQDGFDHVHELLVRAIQKTKSIIRDSREEDVASLSLDLFRL